MLVKTINNILLDAGLDHEEIKFTRACIDGSSEEFLESTAFEKLFEYFCFGTAEMPYGVAKARTGEPDTWILDYLFDVREQAENAPVFGGSMGYGGRR